MKVISTALGVAVLVSGIAAVNVAAPLFMAKSTHPVFAPTPTASPSPKPTPLPVLAAKPTPSPSPKVEARSTHYAITDTKLTVVPAPTPTAVSNEQGKGVWTPYNANCYTDCFPDLTPAAIASVLDAYKGTFNDPAGPKGLPNAYELRHYTCEYMHVLNYPSIPKECDAAMSGVDPSKP